MLRKVMATISTLLICVIVLIGCDKADPVQEDLLNYINKEVQTLVESFNVLIIFKYLNFYFTTFWSVFLRIIY